MTPGVVVIFCLGLFWKRATANAALSVAVLTIPLSFVFKVLWTSLPFLDRMGVVFLILSGIAIVISLLERKTDDTKGIELYKGLFHTKMAFNIGAMILTAIVAVLYIIFW